MSIIKHVTLQKIVAHDFQYDPRSSILHNCFNILPQLCQGKVYRTFSHFKHLHRQHATVSQATCCQRVIGWFGLVWGMYSALAHNQQNHGLNHTQCMDYDFSFSGTVFSCVSRKLAIAWSPIQAILQNVQSSLKPIKSEATMASMHQYMEGNKNITFKIT